jgi:hypothetical protein
MYSVTFENSKKSLDIFSDKQKSDHLQIGINSFPDKSSKLFHCKIFQNRDLKLSQIYKNVRVVKTAAATVAITIATAVAASIQGLRQLAGE